MAINKVVLNDEVKLDLSGDTIVPGDLRAGVTAHDKSGAAITGSMPSVTQATPSITVSSSGLITASGTQSAGYVAAGTKSATQQLSTQAAKTITPSTSAQTAVASGKYTTGAVTVAGDANLVAANIVSGKSIFGVAGSAESGHSTENAIITRSITQYSNADVTVIGNSAFRECISLQEVDIPACTTIKDSAFDLCYGLKSANFPSVESVGGWSFNLCTSLTTLDFPALNTITQNAFNYASKLTAIILRNSDAICALSNTNAFTSTPIVSGTGYIYVPAALVDDYKAATNWSTYADQIRAIEDYPDITGG